MAVTSEKVNSRLKLVFETGVDGEGKATFRTKSFNNIKTTSTPEELYQVAMSLEKLQQRVLISVERNDEETIYDL